MRLNAIRSLAAAALLLALAGSAGAQQAPCSAPSHRDFDFWIGTWEVQIPNGTVVGQNTIRSVLGGCVLHEKYTTTSGAYEGESFNMYDAGRGVWHQTWVDNGGLLLRIEGGLQDGSMVLQGETVDGTL